MLCSKEGEQVSSRYTSCLFPVSFHSNPDHPKAETKRSVRKIVSLHLIFRKIPVTNGTVASCRSVRAISMPIEQVGNVNRIDDNCTTTARYSDVDTFDRFSLKCPPSWRLEFVAFSGKQLSSSFFLWFVCFSSILARVDHEGNLHFRSWLIDHGAKSPIESFARAGNNKETRDAINDRWTLRDWLRAIHRRLLIRCPADATGLAIVVARS